MRNLWAIALSYSKDSIKVHDEFFDLGADSLAMINLATLATKSRTRISIAEIYILSTLAGMAHLPKHKYSDLNGVDDPEIAFPLIPDSIRGKLRQQLSNDQDCVVDMLPCTTFQMTSLIQVKRNTREVMFGFLLRSRDLYIMKVCIMSVIY